MEALSVIVPITDRCEGLPELHARYLSALRSAQVGELEFVYVATSRFVADVMHIRQQAASDVPVVVVEIARDFGDAVAIKLGAAQARHERIMILPPYEQVAPEGISRLLSEQGAADVVCVRRWPRLDSGLKQLPSRILRGLIRMFTDAPYGDAACILSLSSRAVLDEVNMYGEFHRFLSLLAFEQGFAVKIVDLPQSSARDHYFSSSFTYLRRLLDVVAILFLTRFNRRPLRFFGAIGTVFATIGVLGLLYVGFERIFLSIGAANRPVMVLYTLFVVLGVQLVAIGLVGETLIFTQGKSLTEYKIRRIHN